jgi:hypothetical protein
MRQAVDQVCDPLQFVFRSAIVVPNRDASESITHLYQFATYSESVHRHADYSLIGGTVHFFLKRLLTRFIKTTTSEHHLLTRLSFYYHFVENSLILHAKDWNWFTWPAWSVAEADTTSPKRNSNPL